MTLTKSLLNSRQMSRALLFIPFFLGVVAFVVVQVSTGTGDNTGPRGTPAPRAGLDRDGQSSPSLDEGEWFSLSEPIPSEIHQTIANKPFTIPQGSTMLLVGEGVPIFAERTGKPVSLRPEHSSYWLVRNGKAEAKIDAHTGEVFDTITDPDNRNVLSGLVEAGH